MSSEASPPSGGAPKRRAPRKTSAGKPPRRGAAARRTEPSSPRDALHRAAAGAAATAAAGRPRRPAVETGPFGGPLTSAEAKALDARAVALRDQPPHLAALKAMDDASLRRLATELGAPLAERLGRRELMFETLKLLVRRDGLAYGDGVLEVLPDGYGFLRSSAESYLASPDDVYVSPSQVRRFGLRTGSRVEGQVRPPKPQEKFFALMRVEAVDGEPPEEAARRPHFEDLPPAHPTARLRLETSPETTSTRVIDLLAPVGKGQRALIVAPPRSGKTILLEEISHGLAANHPEVEQILLLVDERPEEAAELRRKVKAEVIASTFDDVQSRHLQIAELVLQRARRLVEAGRDVVILLDSLTRLARAFNADAPHTGRVLSGGVDAAALQRPKRFFGAARAVEGGGSLTVIATALIDTGSRMDEVIFEEFKGTGNLEIVLDRSLAERRLFPAFDVLASGTRKEELLLHPDELRRINLLRSVMARLEPAEALELLLGQMRRAKTNVELLLSIRG
ncbi:MAG TPA: transcription termination factor Rho [Planctomycetota bacterium]|nr:transcription termination factor Rho [Planctomycetota bacterium]